MPDSTAGPHAPRLLLVNTVALNVGDAAILLGEIAALRDAFGAAVEIEVADDAPDAAAALYPQLAFVPGLHHATRTAAPERLAGLARS
ncbi:MAG: hypothetical protein ACRELD_16225, partial [Longimicrobiales bacterium]